MSRSKKAETIETVQNVLVDPEFLQDALTLRQIHYQLVATLFYEHTVNNYKRLSRILVEARLNGDIPFDRMIDTERKVIGGDDWGNTDLAGTFLKWKTKEYENAESKFRASSRWFVSPRWFKQKCYVEVWLEKQALALQVAKMTESLKVALVPCKGYSSLTYLKEGVDRIRANSKDKEEVVILYIGDFDPSGLDIARNIQQRLRTPLIFL